MIYRYPTVREGYYAFVLKQTCTNITAAIDVVVLILRENQNVFRLYQ